MEAMKRSQRDAARPRQGNAIFCANTGVIAYRAFSCVLCDFNLNLQPVEEQKTLPVLRRLWETGGCGSIKDTEEIPRSVPLNGFVKSTEMLFFKNKM